MTPKPGIDENHVLTLEEIAQLAQDSAKPAETLMNVAALIARRFQTDVCSRGVKKLMLHARNT